jgi:hypothetical protein
LRLKLPTGRLNPFKDSPNRLGNSQRLDCGADLAVQQSLPVPRFSAKLRGQIHDRVSSTACSPDETAAGCAIKSAAAIAAALAVYRAAIWTSPARVMRERQRADLKLMLLWDARSNDNWINALPARGAKGDP